MKKRIFIYGDSNTWGYIPRGNEDNNITERYDLSERWYSTLLDEFECIVDGANGRAIGYDHPVYPNRNALKTINDDLKDVNNIDLAIIYLGTNDFKEEYLATIQDITNNLDKLINIIINKLNSKIMIIAPSKIKKCENTINQYGLDFENKPLELEKAYKEYATINNYLFASAIEASIGIDGEHMTKSGHKYLGEIVKKVIKNSCNY